MKAVIAWLNEEGTITFGGYCVALLVALLIGVLIGAGL